MSNATPHPGEAVLEPKTCAYCGSTITGTPLVAWCDGNRHHAGPACSLHHLHALVIDHLTETCRTLRNTVDPVGTHAAAMALASPQDQKDGSDPLPAGSDADRASTAKEMAL